jgi:hypothetical protein
MMVEALLLLDAVLELAPHLGDSALTIDLDSPNPITKVSS